MKLKTETHKYHVRRSDLFHDLLRETTKKSYHPLKHVETYFVGEPGFDTGGLTRELWRLFGKHVQQSLCEGKENCLVIRHDASKLQVSIIISSNQSIIKCIYNFNRRVCFAKLVC